MYHLFMYNMCFNVIVKSRGFKHQNLWFTCDYIINNQHYPLKIGEILCHFGEGSVFQIVFKNITLCEIFVSTANRITITVSLKRTGRRYKKLGKTLCHLGEGSMFKLRKQFKTMKRDRIKILYIKIKIYSNTCCHAGGTGSHITIPIIYKYLQNTNRYGERYK